MAILAIVISVFKPTPKEIILNITTNPNQKIKDLISTDNTHIQVSENVWTPSMAFGHTTDLLDGQFKIYDNNRLISSAELTLKEFDIVVDISGDGDLQIDRIDRADLPLFEDYLKSKHALHSKLYRHEYRYIPRNEREPCESDPAQTVKTADDHEVSEGFYNLVFEIFWEEMEGRLWHDGVYTARELLGENLWQELDEKEKRDAASCLMDYALEDSAMIKLAATSTTDLILFEENPAFYGDDADDYSIFITN